MLSPTIISKNFLTSDETDIISKLVFDNAMVEIDNGHKYNDTGDNGRYADRVISEWHDVDYWNLPKLQEMLLPKITKAFGYEPLIENLHALVSYIPYLLHTDIFSERGVNPRRFENTEAEYTIIIPIEDVDSATILFNEHSYTTNDFEQYKKNLVDFDPDIKIDKSIILRRLSHLHPRDLRYLTLQSVVEWKKGMMFAVDRRYFHCSDNFTKQGVLSKKCIVIRTARPIAQ